MFQKILVANRGEIAVRIIGTAKKLGIRTAAVYAADDAGSLHVSLADEAFLLPGTLLNETYLNQELIIDLARQACAEAIHPGYGFLSENASFARKVEKAGLVFIGATPGQISLMGEKVKAFDFVRKLNIPVLPGKQGTVDELLDGTGLPEFPVLVKASSGGGGKGMQVVEKSEDLPAALQKARRQAEQYFGDGTLFIEKYVSKARHIEVQVMGDGRGEVVHLFERECSTQRRYQKLVEESPAAGVSAGLKERLYKYALHIAKAVNYRGAGTIEFLVDQEENCYFLEMNTRLQVEHPVTECITGLDLVEWQFRISAGLGIPLEQQDIRQQGHAIEVRICAEDPAAGFMPSGGTIQAVVVPEAVRWDSFIAENQLLPASYDSLLGKLTVHDLTREGAIEKMIRALKKLLTGGVKTNQLFLLRLIQSETFRTNKMTTCFLEGQVNDLLNLSGIARKQVRVEMVLAAYLIDHYYRPLQKKDLWFKAGYRRINMAFQVEMDHQNYRVTVLKRNSKYCLGFGDRWSELSEVCCDGKKIMFKLDDVFYKVMVFNDHDTTMVQYQAHQFRLRGENPAGQYGYTGQKDVRPEEIPSKIVAGLFGKVVDVLIEPGDRLIKGQHLLVIESMKMEFTIRSPVDATVKAVHVSKGTMVQDKEILVDLES